MPAKKKTTKKRTTKKKATGTKKRRKPKPAQGSLFSREDTDYPRTITFRRPHK